MHSNSNIIILIKTRTLNVETFCGDKRLEQELMIMSQMKVYICCKTYQTVHEFFKKAFKYQKPITPFLVAAGGKRSFIVFPNKL